MTAGKRGSRPAAVALVGTLDAYAKWVANLAQPGGSWGGDAHIGQRELQKLLDIRRASFPDLRDKATVLLLAHADITHVLYEQELRVLRGSGAPRSDERDRCMALTDRQLVAIESIRRAVIPKETIHCRNNRQRRRWSYSCGCLHARKNLLDTRRPLPYLSEDLSFVRVPRHGCPVGERGWVTGAARDVSPIALLQAARTMFSVQGERDARR